jgi:hypothetical protein
VDEKSLVEWLSLGRELGDLNPERLEEVLECLRDIVDTQRILAGDGKFAKVGRRIYG